MTLIDRYLLKETLQNWFAVTLILSLILISNSLIVVLNRTTEQGLPQDAVLPLVFYNAIGLLVALVPLGLYLGIMLALGRLYQDSEMAAMAACGVGTREVYRPVLVCAALAVLLSATLSVWLSPWAARQEADVMRDLASRSELAGLVAGSFNQSRSGDTVVYVSSFSDDRNRLGQVFVQNPESQGDTGVELAQAAQQYTAPDGASYLVFEDGRRYIGTPGQADYRIIEFARHGIRVPPSVDTDNGSWRTSAKTNTELWSSQAHVDKAELHWRWSSPLFALLLALLAVPLSHSAPRKGRYARLAVAILVYVPYSNLLLSAKNWLRHGVVPPELGVWWVHALAGVLLGILLLHRYGWRRLLGSRASASPASAA